ncbi:MAG: pyridoxamine 5'-phosphate oxidase family protein [Thaumarchaeota archaeon]|nr:pyridoxamine 5'-phosphate oxidase family protein [Nitrososphaerota archaeon]
MARSHPRLTAPEVRFLRKPLFCKFASISADGSPHVTPTWSMYEGGLFVFSIPATAIKLRNIGRDDRVTLLFDDAYSWIAVRGRAKVNPRRDIGMDTEKLAVRYMGRREGVKTAVEILRRKHVSVEVTPESVLSDGV